jgi:hypothetical protein
LARRKVRDLCDGVLPAGRAARLIEVCRDIERQPEARTVAEAARA